MNKGKEVFEILMRENADMLLAFLRASVRDSHAVDEMFQETMVVAWRRMEDFDRDRSFGKWLRGIARNLILAHYRKLGSNRETLNESSMDWVEEKFTQIQHRSGDTLSEKLALLADCVEALSDENRNTIEARYMDGCSLPEIAKRLDIARETVKKRLYRAKAQLAKCIEGKLLLGEEVA